MLLLLIFLFVNSHCSIAPNLHWFVCSPFSFFLYVTPRSKHSWLYSPYKRAHPKISYFFHLLLYMSNFKSDLWRYCQTTKGVGVIVLLRGTLITVESVRLISRQCLCNKMLQMSLRCGCYSIFVLYSFHGSVISVMLFLSVAWQHKWKKIIVLVSGAKAEGDGRKERQGWWGLFMAHFNLYTKNVW